MRRGAVGTVGLVVEGHAEFLAFQLLSSEKLLPGLPPMKVLNCKGIGGDTDPSGIAFRVHKLVLQHLAAGRERVVVCIDREARSLCAPGLARAVWEALDRLLRDKAADATRTTIVVADRAFEAFLLADARGLFERKMLKKAPGFSSFEGRLGLGGAFGKKELRELLGRDYSETDDGPRLFRRLNFAEARKSGAGTSGSRSLDKLLRSLGV